MSGLGKKKGERLLAEEEEEDGISNPSMDNELGEYTQTGTDSSPEMEAAEADALVKTLKTKRKRKKKELSDSVISPKDDLARQLKEAKRKSKAAVDESERRELEETAGAVSEVADDGTLPMPEGDEGEPATSEEESRIRKLKKKTEETPLEGPPELEGEEEAKPEVEEEEKPAEVVEPPPRPPSPEAEPEKKPPRMASLRAKMKDRLQKAKEEAMEEVKEEEKTSRKERRLQRDKKQTTRFDTDIDEEELERRTEEQLKRMERKKKKTPTGKEGLAMPTTEESYDFFTRVWEPEPGEEEEAVEKAETEEKEKEEGEEKEEEGEEGEPKPGKEDEQPLITKEDDDIVLNVYTVTCAAEVPDIDEQIRKENEMYHYPSFATVPDTEKLGEEVDVRRLEDEGFYVGTRPATNTWNQNRMENRLLKEVQSGRESSRGWFGEDGRLLALPDPLRSSPSRPPISEEVEPILQLDFKKAVIREFDNRYIDGMTSGVGHYQLDVDINQVEFSHHHLYSKEHALAQKLTQLYEQYVIRQRRNMTSYLGEKLKALKNSALHLQDHIAGHKSEYSIQDRTNYDRRLHDYRAEISQTRHQRDLEEKTDRVLLRNILNTWKGIKKEREIQGYTNTPVKLLIRKEDVDVTQDQFIWKQEIEEEMEELRDEQEREFKHNMLTYEEELKRYQNQQQAKADAKKRIDKRRKKRRGSKQSRGSGMSGLEDYDDEQQRKDEELLTEGDLPQPEPPEKFDERLARENVERKARENRRKPGEPRLHLEFSNTATITPTNNCKPEEQRRRSDVSRCMIFVKVLFNNKEVSRTNLKALSQDFKVSFGQIFNMKIVQWPESITFQVYESFGLGSDLMAELCAPIPDTSVTTASVQLEELEFSSDHRVSHGHAAVGSGLPFTYGMASEDIVILMTTGMVTFSVSWAVDEHGHALVPPSASTHQSTMFQHMKRMDPLAAIGAAGVMDIKKLADWFATSRLDPNDPSNADIVHMLRGKGGDTSHLTPAEYFRLEQLMAEFDFVSEKELMDNRRFRLIQLRDEEVQEFRNYKMVPALEREVPKDAFAEYERKKREEQRLLQEDDIESQRAAVKRFRQKIREQVMRTFRYQAHMKSWDDIVKEEMVPNVALLGTSIMKIFARRTPLKPTRKKQKKVAAQSVKGDEVRIVVNIGRAQNIPVRITASMQPVDELSGKDLYEGLAHHPALYARSGTVTQREPAQRQFEQTMVRPFVEVMFQNNRVRTSVGDGSNPSFNEELEIPFKAPFDDFSPASLETVSDSLFLNVFDEVVVDVQEDDRERDRVVHQRIEKKWLGSLKIPFTTIYFNGKIDGTFRVNAPPVLLGYVYEGLGHGSEDIPMNKDMKTLLSLYISIQPPLTQPEPVKEKFSTNEDETTMVLADQWQEAVSSRFTPKRELKTFVTDINFKSVFITRYFRPIKPPDEFTGKSPDLVARYVSLIPFVADSSIFPGLCDIWNTCDQFLQMLSGDEEEHAILLVNYLLSFDMKAYLICGNAIPEGPTSYVLTDEGNDFYIWNPSTGEKFRTNNPTCPLRSIGCLVNAENIWANIQPYDKPDQMMYRLSDTSCWEPLFNKSRPNPGLQSIQPDSLYYYPTDKDYVTELQEKIMHVLKNKIMDWRTRYITRWNRHCSQIMRKTLPLLEESLGLTVGEQHIKELEQSFSTYKVSGFPINMPFTDVDAIVETVYATGVHGHESSEMEFALAVYVHPYPNSVLSVWVYVASLLKNR